MGKYIEIAAVGSAYTRDYNPDEPRIPSGHPHGGEWTRGSGSYLIPALKIDEGRFAVGGPSHTQALKTLPIEEQRAYIAQGKHKDTSNFYFLNEKGQYLNRQRAREYAEEHDLLSKIGAEYQQPELIAEHLKPEAADPSHTTVLLDRIKKEGGFTYSIVNESSPKPGDKAYVVSPYKDRERVLNLDRLTPKDLVRYIASNKDMLAKDDHYFGAWVDEGKAYLDVSVVMPTPEKARALCEKHDQLAYFDLEKMQTVNVKKRTHDQAETDTDQGTDARRYLEAIREDDGAQAYRGRDSGSEERNGAFEKEIEVAHPGSAYDSYNPEQLRVPKGFHAGGQWTRQNNQDIINPEPVDIEAQDEVNDAVHNSFPHMNNFEIIGPPDNTFNCIGWALGMNNHFIWPGYNIENFDDLIDKAGGEECEDGKLEPGFTKIALFGSDLGYKTEPTHMARQLSNGKWTSKLGGNGKIIHELNEMEGGCYGHVIKFYKIAPDKLKAFKEKYDAEEEINYDL